ncbi:filamentous hemagglutinin N-terminal domain-containing protein, partial [Rhodoferax sp.]|uniref:two-partner secretion domain-containing protein n=1 Tax=Rhodoferax sp. TaxID=50421 RepID=UPI00352436B2
MNKTYRLVWRASANAFVAVAECCRAKGKGGARGSALVLAGVVSSLLSSGAALAAPGLTELPTGGKLVAGSASISGANGHLSIQQSTPRAAIDWQSFNVGSQAQVQFLQPSAASVTLNRVLGGQASEILGRIAANGQVFLVNPSGVYFGRGASVNVGALVATTHSISNTDFMAGKNTFARLGSTGSVVNEGQLRAALEAGLGGYIALMAPEVRNQGVIVAQLGAVALASGESITLDISGSHTLAGLTVSPSQIKSLVDNRHLVEAPGGLIILSAQAANALQGGVVKNSGDLEASGLVQDGGRIRLVASDQIDVGGSLRANAAPSSNGDGGSITAIADLKTPDSVTKVSAVISAKGGDLGGQGGFVETSASRLKIDSPTRVDTLGATGNVGMWLLDPVNITVQAVGGDVTGSTIATALQTTDVTLDSNIGSCTGVACGVLGGTAGDITVNDAIATTVDGLPTTLTLNAFKNIAINAAISNAGASALNVVLNSDSTRNGIGGVTLNGTGSIATNGGNVELYGNSIDLQAGSSINTTPVAPFPSGVIALIGNAMTIAGAVTGNADLNIMPLTANKTIGIAGGAGDIQLTATNFSTDFSNTFSGINIGDLTTGTITVGAAGVTIAAGAGVPVTFQTNAGMVLNGDLNAVDLQLNLFDGLASMSTFSGSGNISAATLFLAGSGTTQFLLNTAIGNNVTTLVGLNGSGNLSFYNSTALSVGNIFGLGVATDGLIDIQTLNGNLTVTQAITTTSAAANAITLNAGRAETALTAGASNIRITGAGTVTAAAGIAKLYSGSVAGSTGLTALVGSGSGRFRYSSDEVTSNFSAALSTGLNAIYRESSAITVQQMAVVSTYGTAFGPVGYEVAAGTLQNGDINVGTIGATLGSSGSAASPVGAYDLSITGLFPYSSLGYALTGATNTGGHTITQRPINLTANAGQTKIYGNTDPTLTYATEANGINSGIVGSD